MLPPYVIFLMLASLWLLAGCSGSEAPPHQGTGPAPTGATSPVVTGITVGTVDLTVLPEVSEAVGTVRSRRQSVVASQLMARIVAAPVNVGARLRPGQLLVQLDDRDTRTQLRKATAGVQEAHHGRQEVERLFGAAGQAIAAAQAQEALALSTRTRYQTLLERRSVAPQEYDEVAARYTMAAAAVARAREEQAALVARQQQALARIAQAQADLANAEVVLGYTRITAPVAGIVVAKAVEVGSLASPGVPLYTIEEEHYRFEASVPEAQLPKIQPGQQATIRIEALGRAITAPVVEIVPAADPLSRTFTVKLDLPEEPGLRTGLYGKAQFHTGQRQVLLVPQQAIVERGQLQGVFVVAPGNITRLRLVKTGRSDAAGVEILSGLHRGERLIVEGVERVVDGSRVGGEG